MISNKVFTGTVGRKLDLRAECLLCLGTYSPPKNRFPGATLKLQSGTFLLFRSGKVVINGVRTEPDPFEFLNVTGMELFDVKLSHCSGYLQVGHICTRVLQERLSCWYEPELHPGVMFKIDNVSVIVYSTGSVIFCGSKSEELVSEVEHKIKEMINTSGALRK